MSSDCTGYWKTAVAVTTNLTGLDLGSKKEEVAGEGGSRGCPARMDQPRRKGMPERHLRAELRQPPLPKDGQLVSSSSPILPHGVVLTAAPGAQLP